MDRNKFSLIAHRDHVYSNPISEQKMDKIIGYASLQPDHKVIDIGAGKCELLIRLIEKYDCSGTAVELYEGAIAQAKKKAENRIASGRIQFIEKDAREAIEGFAPASFDMGICVGSTHAFGGLDATLAALKKCVKKGGYLLIGEGYWKQKPSQDYLYALGAGETELRSHFENVKAGEDAGLIPLWASVASEDDWDEYEWLYSMSIENYCHEHPDDPDIGAMLAKIRTWRRTYLQWGRDTLGFALYLFRH